MDAVRFPEFSQYLEGTANLAAFPADNMAEDPHERFGAIDIAVFGLFVAPWLLFAVSLFLPATAALELPENEVGEPIYGWQMYRLFKLLLGLFLILEHPRILAQFPVLALANFAMVVLPVMHFLRVKGLLVALLLFSSAAVAVVSLDDYFVAPRLIGFYVYLASIVGACLACVATVGIRLARFGLDEDDYW